MAQREKTVHIQREPGCAVAGLLSCGVAGDVLTDESFDAWIILVCESYEKSCVGGIVQKINPGREGPGC